MSITFAGVDQSARRRTKLRRRFLLVSIALLSTLLAILGIGFAADAGTSTVTVTSADGVLVYPVAGSGSAPDRAAVLPYDSATTNSGTNEVQSLSATNSTTGTFTLSFNGATTSALNFNASATDIDGALEGLSNIGSANVTTAGGPINSAAVTVTFVGTLAGTNVGQITVNNVNLDGTLPVVTTAPQGSGDNTWSPNNTPSWSVAAGTAGEVDSPGDLVYIDATVATSTKVQISVYVTNLEALAVNYSSWAFGIAVYQSESPTAAIIGTNSTTDWVKVADSFLTSDRGANTFTVTVDTGGKHLAIGMPEGTFYTVQTDTANGALQPSFFVRATEL